MKNIISVVFLVELLFSVLEVDIVELTAKQSSTNLIPRAFSLTRRGVSHSVIASKLGRVA